MRRTGGSARWTIRRERGFRAPILLGLSEFNRAELPRPAPILMAAIADSPESATAHCSPYRRR